MDFNYIKYDNNYDEGRYKTKIDNKPYFIHITKEALEDDLNDDVKEVLTPNKKKKLEKIVNARLASGDLVWRLDDAGVPYKAVLIKKGELA